MLRIIQISDLHLRAEPQSLLRGFNVDTGLNAVLAHIRQHHWPADALLITGDLAHDEVGAYGRLQTRLNEFGLPAYCLPGNHDNPHAMRAWLSDGLLRWQQEIMLGNWQILMLDSSIHDCDSGHLADSELTFLDQRLAAYPEQPALVCVHHHPVPTGIDWLDKLMLDNADDLFAVLDRYPRVRGLLWGHVHQATASQRGAMQLFSVPATSCQFEIESADPEHALPGYRWLELGDDGEVRSGIERVALS